MIKNRSYFGKFICPSCHKVFRAKVVPVKNINGIEMVSEGLPFECHIHCPKCEEYIPQVNDVSKKGKNIIKKFKEK